MSMDLDNYADRVVIDVRLSETMMGPELDESWVLTFNPELSWDEKETREELKGIASSVGGGCCGERYILSTQRNETRWGPSAASVEFLMTVSADLTGGLLAALGVLGMNAVRRIRQDQRLDPDLCLTFDETSAESEAMQAVDRRIGSRSAHLTTREISTPEEGVFQVVLYADELDQEFLVEVRQIDGLAWLSRVVRVRRNSAQV